MRSRCMSLLPRTTLHSDSKQTKPFAQPSVTSRIFHRLPSFVRVVAPWTPSRAATVCPTRDRHLAAGSESAGSSWQHGSVGASKSPPKVSPLLFLFLWYCNQSLQAGYCSSSHIAIAQFNEVDTVPFRCFFQGVTYSNSLRCEDYI